MERIAQQNLLMVGNSYNERQEWLWNYRGDHSIKVTKIDYLLWN